MIRCDEVGSVKRELRRAEEYNVACAQRSVRYANAVDADAISTVEIDDPRLTFVTTKLGVASGDHRVVEHEVGVGEASNYAR